MRSIDSPLISIITPTLNRAETLETAIQSVYAQGIDNLEYIIMDGGSTDGTCELVTRYTQIRFYSEPDEGLYDALNKGIHLAKGRYIGWLNSDDLYPPGALIAALKALEEHPDWAAVFGDAEVVSNEGPYKSILIPGFRSEFFLQKATSDAFSINAGLIKHEVFSHLNFFDTAYKIASDRDFMFRFGLASIPFGSIEQTLYIYQTFSTSLTFSKNLNGKISGDLEEMDIAVKFLQTNSESEIKQICTAWHSRASADGTLLSLLSRKRKLAKEIRSKGIRVDPHNWRKYFLRGIFLYCARKLFPPRLRAHFSKLKNLWVTIRICLSEVFGGVYLW